jgi:hypothetical protein
VLWFHAVAESRHELQNPASAAKIRLVGAAGAGLDADSRVLDMLVGRKAPQPATGSP